ncbi:MAG: hypothetical protein MK185_04690 [Saccharospirillaceae bacterium]|nr:hypothetical protein [Saccharospirillaceae bacterium]
MTLQPMINLRNAVKGALKAAYADRSVLTAELTSVVSDEDDGVNLSEFFTVFFEDWDENEEDGDLDSDQYEVTTRLTVGYFNEAGGNDQSVLDGEAGRIREVIMDLPIDGDIKRDGGEFKPSQDGSTPGVYFFFDVKFSN